MGRVFISYCHKDFYDGNERPKEGAAIDIIKFVEILKKKRILYWFDKRSIKGGYDWELSIKYGINNSDVFLCFNSDNYQQSEYCKKELLAAIDLRKTIIPVALKVPEKIQEQIFDKDGKRVLSPSQQIKVNDLSENGKTDIELKLSNQLIKDHYLDNCFISTDYEILDNSLDFDLFIENQHHKASNYRILEPLIEFLRKVAEDESCDKYISTKAKTPQVGWEKGRVKFYLPGEADSTFTKGESNTTEFVKKIIDKILKASDDKDGVDHADKVNNNPKNEIYKHLKHLKDKVEAAYNNFCNEGENSGDIHTLADELENVSYARRFLESLFNSKIEYKVTDAVIEVARMLCFGDSKNCKECIPKLINQDNNSITYKELKGRVQNGESKIFIHTTHGSGTSSLLRGYFEEDENSLYINLANYNYKDNKTILENCLGSDNSLSYRLSLSLVALLPYSINSNKITLLIDNFDLLSEGNKNHVISEIESYGNAFNIVFVSSNANVDGKLALKPGQNMLECYEKYSIAKLDKERFVSYIQYKLDQEKLGRKEIAKIAKEFENLKENDSIFEIFDSFTKINLLAQIIKNEFSLLWSDSVSNLLSDIKYKFNSRIMVYQSIFECDNDYSIPKKISLRFKDATENLNVDIKDIIIEQVIKELDCLKEIAYNSKEKQSNIKIQDHSLRFRDHYYYEILKMDTDNQAYSFSNEDIRSYLSASYIVDCIEKDPDDLHKLAELLKGVEKEYSVLEYLKNLDILSYIGIENLKKLLSDKQDEQYKSIALALLKIIQYYDSVPLKKVFLKNAQIEVIPDKFFMGAENIFKITIPSSVKVVGRAAFSNMPNLKCIYFAPETKSKFSSDELIIKPWAIINCPELKEIRLPENYKQYNQPLVSRCDKLENLVVDKNNQSFTTLQERAMLVSKDEKHLFLATNALKDKVKIPGGITHLENNCLAYLKHVTEYVIPASVEEVATNFSDFCDSLKKIRVASNNKKYFSDKKGYMYTKDKKTLFRVPSGTENDVEIPEGVEVIGSDSISCCRKTKKICVPKSVTKIEDYAFADTNALEVLQFEDFEEVTELGKYILLSTNDNVIINNNGPSYLLETFNENATEKIIKEPVQRPLTVEDFLSKGIEIVREGTLGKKYENIAVARDITLSNNIKYSNRDFNIMLIGMTEYNKIMDKTAAEADEYFENLISTTKHINAVLFSRDLPILSQFENDNNEGISVFRTPESSTAATNLLQKIIEDIGKSE